MVQKGFKFKFCLWKAYFDCGYGLTNYFFKLVAVFGLVTQLAKATFIVLAIYSVACLVLGWWWYNYGFIDEQNEVSNLFNPFQREVRKALKTEKYLKN